MTTVKRLSDLTGYMGVLPYSSELFGVYQPLLGWRSSRQKERIESEFKKAKERALSELEELFSSRSELERVSERQIKVKVEQGALGGPRKQAAKSVVFEQISAALPIFDDYDPGVWEKVITKDTLSKILEEKVPAFYSRAFEMQAATHLTEGREKNRTEEAALIIEEQIERESRFAGFFSYLVENQSHETLKEVFYSANDVHESARGLLNKIEVEDSATSFLQIDNLDPTDSKQLDDVVLSPISVVHLFRQYFFELDTFLGPPESHVWLSPGSAVELIEEHTRKSLVEREVQINLDIFSRTEKTERTQDDLSEAVSEDNSKTLSLGASVTASYSGIEATSSFDYSSSQNQARERTHKQMREQTQSLSSEIRKNYKTTFRTVTEVTELNSTRHVLRNETPKLINYELRRKMRQVGVQVQDVGTYLCWQAYVDDPGRSLGLAELMHIAQSPELGDLQHPEEIPLFQPVKASKTISIPFISVGDVSADKKGEVYVNGEEADNNEFMAKKERIQHRFQISDLIAPKPSYELADIEFDSLGLPVMVSRVGDIVQQQDRASFTLNLDSANFQGQDSVNVKLTLHWVPTAAANADIAQKNAANAENFRVEEKAAFEAAFLETAKERVDAMSGITTRNSAELREEERIVVYRALIQDLLSNNVTQRDDRARHVVSEVLNSIFDVDKMLYFVAPEWWRPRMHQSTQQLFEHDQRGTSRPHLGIRKPVNLNHSEVFTDKLDAAVEPPSEASDVDPTILSANTVGWGDAGSQMRDNYYITEDSMPARFGSSLGWLMQLDGDNRRNAFLNSPWVKAVMPIRPGKELAAINWLKAVEGMDGIDETAIYRTSNANEVDIDGDPLDGQPMLDVLEDLAAKIKKKHEESLATSSYPKKSEVSDPALVDEGSTVTATPIDRVYEHGFFPLENSFRANIGDNFEIFDQWTEVLPTDQSVPVEVEYDPKTGRQI